jgi:hypothetical protein
MLPTAWVFLRPLPSSVTARLQRLDTPQRPTSVRTPGPVARCACLS